MTINVSIKAKWISVQMTIISQPIHASAYGDSSVAPWPGETRQQMALSMRLSRKPCDSEVIGSPEQFHKQPTLKTHSKSVKSPLTNVQQWKFAQLLCACPNFGNYEFIWGLNIINSKSMSNCLK